MSINQSILIPKKYNTGYQLLYILLFRYIKVQDATLRFRTESHVNKTFDIFYIRLARESSRKKVMRPKRNKFK